MLIGEQVSKYFGGIQALKNVDFQVGEGEIVGLVGPNGAGKTTLFNVISGVYKPNTGAVTFYGKRIDGFSSSKICKMGIGRTFQIVRPFANLTALENVAMGAMHGKGYRLSKAKKNALKWLEFVGLLGKRDLPAGSLTLVERKTLEVARALATEPKLLLLDEVMAGLNPVEQDGAIELIRKIRKQIGITVFLVEHVMKVVMSVSDKVMVLNFGEKIAEGSPDKVVNDTKVIQAYLGVKQVGKQPNA